MGTPAFAPPVPAAAGQLVCRPAGMAAAAAAAATAPPGHRLAQTPRGRRVAAVRAAPACMKAGHGAEVAASAAASTASAAAAAADGDVAAAGIRTVALAGKDGCGKTALASALLALAASKRNAKGVDGGAPEETAHGMTLYNHVYCAQVDDHRGTLWGGCRCRCGTQPLSQPRVGRSCDDLFGVYGTNLLGTCEPPRGVRSCCWPAPVVLEQSTSSIRAAILTGCRCWPRRSPSPPRPSL